MKRFTFIAVVLCLAFVMAAPVMATDVDISGAYRVRGNMVSGQDMNTGATNAYMEMRLRVNTVFKVTDKLRLTTRFDALDGKRYGDTAGDNGKVSTTNAGAIGSSAVSSHTHTATSSASPGKNFDFDRAYMTFETGIGKFDIGRMSGGTWATSFADSVGERDRVKFTTKAGPVTLLGIFEKNVEGDEGITTADSDGDVWYLAGIFKTENLSTGLLWGYINYKQNSDTDNYITRYHAILPYVTAKFGPVRLQFEARINTGDSKDYDSGAGTDVDKDELAWNFEVGANFGAVDVEGGYAYISGDDGTNAAEDSSFVGFGDDWEKLWILTGSTGSVAGGGALGGIGNFSDGGGHPGYGASLLYGGGSFAIGDALKLGVMLGYGVADEVPATWKDDLGYEIDFKVNWKIMDNLSYSFVAAYLAGGEYWYGVID